jgi:hypothetical protein
MLAPQRLDFFDFFFEVLADFFAVFLPALFLDADFLEVLFALFEAADFLAFFTAFATAR